VPAEEGPIHAIVDRITDGLAVILVGDEETEHHVPVEELPAGVAEGTVVAVRLRDDRLEVMHAEPGETERQRVEMRERLSRLRQERGGGRFTRDD
jgi:hypothetical protein